MEVIMNGNQVFRLLLLLCLSLTALPLDARHATSSRRTGRSLQPQVEAKKLKREGKRKKRGFEDLEEESPQGRTAYGVELPALPPMFEEELLKQVARLPEFTSFLNVAKELRKINRDIERKSGPSSLLLDRRKRTVVRLFEIGKRLRERYDGKIKELELRIRKCQDLINSEQNEKMLAKRQDEKEKLHEAMQKPQAKIDIINHFLLQALEEPGQNEDNDDQP
jgi:hypothetical protein